MSSSISTNDFEAGLNGFFELLAKRSRLLIALAAVFLLIVAAAIFISNEKEQKSDAGRNTLYLAQKSLDSELEAIARANTPVAAKAPVTSENAMFTKLNVDTQLGEGVNKLKAVVLEYSNTRSGYEAMLLLGKTYLNHGDAAIAADWFQKSVDSAPSSLDRALSWESLGYAYENEGKYKEALGAFDKALDVGQATLKGDLLLSKARTFESLKDTAQAKANYDQVMAQLPGTEYAKLADLFKARLK